MGASGKGEKYGNFNYVRRCHCVGPTSGVYLAENGYFHMNAGRLSVDRQEKSEQQNR